MGLVTIVVIAGAVGGWFAFRYRSIERSTFHRDTLATAERSAPQNFLVVGTDSREFVDNVGDEAAFGTVADVGQPHADTILILRTFPHSKRVALASFPRDLSVKIAGTDTEDRINSALANGPDQLVQTITQNFGIPINHFIEVDFRGFEALVNAVGGVTVFFPAPVRDWDEEKQLNPTGLRIDQPGCIELQGAQALAYVRSRHYQQLIDGAWKKDPAGDLNRITRQQELFRTTLAQSARRGLRNPARLNTLLGVAVHNVTLDDRFGLGDLTALSRQFRTLAPESLQTYSLPTAPGKSPTGADVLFLDVAAAQPALDVFRGKEGASTELLPGAVRVRVVDDGRRPGTANAAAFRLAAAGFVVDPSVLMGASRPKTVVTFGPNGRAKAELVASRLAAPAQLEQVENPGDGVDVMVTIGADWMGVRETAPDVPTSAPATVDTSVVPDAAPGSSAPAPTVAPTTIPAPAPLRHC